MDYLTWRINFRTGQKDKRALDTKGIIVSTASACSAGSSKPSVADISPRNIENIIAGSSLVINATDNIETRLLINDASVKNNIP